MFIFCISPEAHNIIRCGKGVSPRPSLDRSIYNKHLESHAVKEYPLPASCIKYIDAVIDSEDLIKFKKEIKRLTSGVEDGEDEEAFDFLEDIFRATYKAYSSHQDIGSSEAVFNQLFVYPYLEAVARSVKDHKCKADFIHGEVYLDSMTKQLKSLGCYINDKFQYKADGLIKLYGIKKLEILLLETSGPLNNADKVKINFDHHKGTFGSLALLKCIADEFSFASVEKFKKVKVFFVHAAESQIQLWSIRFEPEGIFDFWRETFFDIKPDFEDKLDALPRLISFCWTMKSLVQEAVDNIVALREEHNIKMAKYRYSSDIPVLLYDIINPIILKLTKEEDSIGMAELGPFYSPPHD
ncbi:hypothetical protein G6F46_001409 [Rhizopus delemar]|uniref:Uncharacterized protein n=1 Tax=Rhizopus oryzae TaxID=64495 RepID=A0A9P7C5E7_RHIOR|nr:hypothetical protein G6F55_010319 [Rhizopus delemar]KAG1536156.1 hypothetical protein G6F51_011122 [Rhizopus arrhizus]KAG1496254.1 hypothetical protein G6F54_006605 [Rhizopus delemar]KAG1515704.1 hypothetical protein G6F53_002709 [Rhizopus delemar]KAG1601560.1 hypothetical protein G6F47_003567 [Rhizopus delemar]